MMMVMTVTERATFISGLGVDALLALSTTQQRQQLGYYYCDYDNFHNNNNKPPICNLKKY